ncbi:phosphorylcholine transferase LicD [Anaerovibrio sp.]|uniref:LicD family protein n=1 Tax=Anaerovibrio sp. TaxID=1872532 RepID=UPI00388DE37D
MDKVYITDIEHDEIRSGFLVTTDRKKIWNKEIELLLEVDRICKKHNIPYFAIDGTMLGCARHNGFIPWDDDIDVAIMRPDYMRFVEAAAQEIKAPFFVQNIYTDNIIINWTKIMDDRTSAIEDWDGGCFHQGIFVDVFPMDAVADGSKKGFLIDEMSKELWMCVIAPKQIEDGLQNSVTTHVARQTLERILGMPLYERMKVYEDFCVKHFDESSKVAFQMSYWCNRSKPVSKNVFKGITYMDFEGIKVPMPGGYDEFLTEVYGNWRVPVHSPSAHEGVVMSADIPYDVMLRDINRELLQCGDYLWK